MSGYTIRATLSLPDVRRALGGLDGQPIGGWGSAEQARAQFVDSLPHRLDRVGGWTASDLIAVACDLSGTHYRVLSDQEIARVLATEVES